LESDRHSFHREGSHKHYSAGVKLTQPLETPIIGGMFGLRLPVPNAVPCQERTPAFLTGPHVLLANARSALTLLSRTLRPVTVWLPSYLCGVIRAVFHANLVRVRFYAIDAGLQIAAVDWLAEVEPGDMVVFIDYFGFNLWTDWGAEARKRGAWVVEDACQALLNDAFSAQSHFVIASPRKFVGVPDGGMLLAMPGVQLPSVTLPSPPSDWWFEAFSATLLRGEFDRHGGDRSWFELFRHFDPNGPMNPHAMSELSAQLLGRFDYADIGRRRRENYEFLLRELGHLAMFTRLPDGVVPLGFPIRLAARDQVRQALFTDDIFPPVHWPLDDAVPQSFAESHRLSREVMTLPCDQRLGIYDLSRLVAALRKATTQIGTTN
jgi:hypothetical protein